MKKNLTNGKFIAFTFITFTFSLLPITFSSAEEQINISPIVQIISYKSIYGKYIQMLGWGSASIINDKGIIITNNHVVDDGKGNIADAFSICMTKKEKEKPTCDYTASLIARDETKDIAILKIDNKDVKGNETNYKQFKVIKIDFEYTPKTQDDVVAIGYPWIGSDTITQTKGIVSGISKYNDVNYIKTDALIAGGNSGGGLINSQGELIGIPTFGVGGFFDPSMGYALSIAEAKEFVNSNINKDPIKNNLEFDFASYKKNIDKINETLLVKDDIFNVKFSGDYEVQNYINNKKIEIKSRNNKNIILQNISISVEQTPNIINQQDFFYYIETKGFYSRDYQKLKKIIIGGLEFYTPIYIDDKSQGESDTIKSFVSQIPGNKVIKIDINLGSYEEKNTQKIQNELQNFLDNIGFNNISNSYNFDFKLLSPKISVKTLSGIISNDIAGYYVQYLGNLHELISIEVGLKDLYSGKGQTTEKIYESETNNISNDYKSIINIQGHTGFIYCNINSSSYGPYVDEKGNQLNQSECIIKILEGINSINNEEFFITIRMISDKNNLSKNLDQTITLIKNNLTINNGGFSNITNIIKNQVNLEFKDLIYQTKGFKEKLKLLIKYGLLKNNITFDGDKPLKWVDFIDIYLKMVYKIDLSKQSGCKTFECKINNESISINGENKTIKTIIKEMGINLESYVNYDKISYFPLYLEMVLAGIENKDINEEFLYYYSNLKEENIFEETTQKIKEFNFQIFGNKKIGLSEIGGQYSDYISTKQILFVIGKGIVENQLYGKGKFHFEYEKSNEPENDYYEIMTKAQAIDFITNQIDFGLFDYELAKKKQTMISN